MKIKWYGKSVFAAFLTVVFAGCPNGSQPEPPSLQSIAVITPPAKTLYAKGEALDISGIDIVSIYTDGSTKQETVTRDDISGYDPNTLGLQTLTVTINGKTATFTVTVNAAALVSIAVTSPPGKTSYAKGEVLDISGLAVTGTYTDGSANQMDISGGTVSGYNPNTLGDQTLTVTIDGKTATFTVTVNAAALVSIAVTSPPDKTVYDKGEVLDISGLAVTGTYTDEKTNQVDVSAGNISGYNPNTLGDQTLTVTIDGKTTTFAVTVNAQIPVQINFAGPDDEDITIDNNVIVDITQDPYYEPSWPVLQNNIWYDDSNPVKNYQFFAQAGTSYAINWNDSFQGNASKSADIGVSAYWKASNASIFGRTDSGWNTPRNFTADRSGIVVLKVEYYSGGNTTGTFALKYSGGSGSSALSVISQTDTLVLSAPAAYAAYKWIIDNTASTVTTNTLSLAAGSLVLGPHSVTLIIYKQEGSVQVPYSTTRNFTVEP
jgi:hypothetical protein